MEFLSMKSINVVNGIRNRDGQISIKVKFILDKMENVFIRQYMRLDSFIANIIAYASIILSIMRSINFMINFKRLKLKLFNEFWNILDEKKKVKLRKNFINSSKNNLKICEGILQEKRAFEIVKNKRINKELCEENIQEKRLFDIVRKYKKINHLEMFKSCLFSSRRIQIVDYTIEKSLDLRNFIKTVNEIDLLKSLP
jgi:hypothetical protein